MKKTLLSAFIASALLFAGCESVPSSTTVSSNQTSSEQPKTAQNEVKTEKISEQERGQGIKITVPTISFKGSTDTDNWIPQFLQDTLTSQISEYSSMTVIDRANEALISNEQLHSSESGLFSDEDYIEIGKFTNAQYVLAGNIINIGGKYSITLRVNDLTKNEIKASFNKQYTLEQIQNGIANKQAVKEILPKLGIKLTDKEITALSTETNSVLQETKLQETANLAKGMAAETKNKNVVEALSFYASSGNEEAMKRFTNLSNTVSTGNIRQDALNDIAARRAWLENYDQLQEYLDKNSVNIKYDIRPQAQEVDYRTETVTIPFNYRVTINNTAIEVYNQLAKGLEATGKERDWGYGKAIDSGRSNFRIEDPEYRFYFELKDNKGNLLGTSVVRTSPRLDSELRQYQRNLEKTSRPKNAGKNQFFYSSGISSSNKDEEWSKLEFTKIDPNKVTDNLSFGLVKITVNENNRNSKIKSYENPPVNVTVLGKQEGNVVVTDGFNFVKPTDPEPYSETKYQKGSAGPAGGLIFYADKKGFTVNGVTYHYMEISPYLVSTSYLEGTFADEDSNDGPFTFKGKGQVKTIGSAKAVQNLGSGYLNHNELLKYAQQNNKHNDWKSICGYSFGGYNDWFIPDESEWVAFDKYLWWNNSGVNGDDLQKVFTFGGTYGVGTFDRGDYENLSLIDYKGYYYPSNARYVAFIRYF